MVVYFMFRFVVAGWSLEVKRSGSGNSSVCPMHQLSGVLCNSV